ncbi:MAG: response regulator [Candidatus Omnitrophota bacterium]|jgi:DNA-binding LytR/AlgR family response regulator
MIRAYIVEDELLARNELKRLLRDEADFTVAGEAVDGGRALEEIERLRPEVVFLDIHIPKVSGIEVAAELVNKAWSPRIIFVTAFDRYAIQAFEVNAIDYILKPYDQERLHRACEKLRKWFRDNPDVRAPIEGLMNFLSQQKTGSLIGYPRSGNDRIFIHLEDAVYFHISEDEVTVFLRDGQELVVSGTLKSLMDKLDPSQYRQSHRSYLVNLAMVEKLSPLFGGNFEIVMKDPARSRVPLSRRYAKKFREN